MAFPDPTTFNLRECWAMNASSGNETGVHASNVLVDNNTCGTTTGIISGARTTVLANTEYFNIASATAISAGLAGSDRDFSFTGWVYFDALSAAGQFQGVVGCFKNGSNGVQLYNVSGSDTLRWLCRHNGGGQAFPQITGLSTATWYFFHVYHDSVNNEVGIGLNGGSYTTNGFDANGNTMDGAGNDFYVMNGHNGTWNCGGRVDQVCLWDHTLLTGTPDPIAALYNGGSGVAYSAGGGGGARPLLVGGKLVHGGPLIRRAQRIVTDARALPAEMRKNLRRAA